MKVCEEFESTSLLVDEPEEDSSNSMQFGYMRSEASVAAKSGVSRPLTMRRPIQTTAAHRPSSPYDRDSFADRDNSLASKTIE
jgi:hypothetical protein